MSHAPAILVYMSTRTRNFISRTIAVALVGLMFGGIAWLGARGPAYECEATTVIVRQGDTAWSLAARYCTGHTGEATYDLVRLHGSSWLYPGEVVTLP